MNRFRSYLPFAAQVLVAVFAGVITLKDQHCTVRPGLDETYIWPLNYFLGNNKEILADITYSYGPLCLLKWPVAIGDHILISALAYVFVSALFTFYLIQLYKVANNKQDFSAPLIAAVVLLVVVNIDYIYLGVVAVCLLYYRNTRRVSALAWAVLVTVAGCYIRTTMLVFLLCAWPAFVIEAIYTRRFRLLAGILLGGVITYFIAGYLLFNSFAAAYRYGVNNIGMSFSFPDVLTLYPPNKVWALVVTVLLVVVAWVVFRKKPAGYVLTMFALVFVANWKYSMSFQEFWHVIFFVYLLVLVFVLAWVVQVHNRGLLSVLFLAAISIYTYNARIVINFWDNLLWFPDITYANERILHHKEFKDRIWSESQQYSSVNLLPDSIRQVIGNATVDILPYDLSYAMVNELNYTPRPTLQLALFGTNYDKTDAAFYASGKAPQYLIWHVQSAGKTQLDGIINNYLPNAAPATFDAVLQQYEPVYNDEYRSIWKKSNRGKAKLAAHFKEVQVNWFEWIDVPPVDSNALLRVSVQFPFSTKYSLRKFIYKGLPVYMEYETVDGSMYSYAIAPSLAATGVLAQPFYTQTNGTYKAVRRIRFYHERPGAGYMDGMLLLNWQKIEL